MASLPSIQHFLGVPCDLSHAELRAMKTSGAKLGSMRGNACWMVARPWALLDEEQELDEEQPCCEVWQHRANW